MAGKESSTPKPKKQRWYSQLWQAYKLTRGIDPAVTWWILATFIGTVAVALGIGFLVGHVVYLLVMGVPFAMLAAMFVFSRRVEAAQYRTIEGQPGAASAALRTIRRGWTFTEEPVAVDPRTQDLVFRGVGRAGVVLVGEGTSGRVAKLLESEKKRTARAVSGAPIILLEVGNGEGQVPLRKLPAKVMRLKPVLSKAEVGAVIKRLTALGGVRMPIPKGVDPTRVRPDRKGMRGR